MKHFWSLIVLSALMLVNIHIVVAQATTRKGVAVTIERFTSEKEDETKLINATLDNLVSFIPTSWLAASDETPRFSIRLVPNVLVLKECQYQTRLRTDIVATITDRETSTELGSQSFVGFKPENCAFIVSDSTPRWLVGSPIPASVAHWIVETLTAADDNLPISDLPQLPIVLLGHSDRVNDARYNLNGSKIVTGGDDDTTRVWDAETGHQLFTLDSGLTYSVNFSPDGHTLVTAGDWGGMLWSADTWEKLPQKLDPARWDASYSPDGRYIVTAADDKNAHIWDANTGKEVLQLVGHTEGVNSAEYSSDGRYVVTGSRDDTIRVWDASTGKSLLILVNPSIVDNAVFSPNGNMILIASHWDETSRVWNVSTGKEQFHIADTISADYSPDGHYIVTGSKDNVARLWNAQTGQKLAEFSWHVGSVDAAHFSPDGKRVVTSSGDNTALIWDISNFIDTNTEATPQP